MVSPLLLIQLENYYWDDFMTDKELVLKAQEAMKNSLENLLNIMKLRKKKK